MQRKNKSVYFDIYVRSEVRPTVLKKSLMEHGEHTQQKERQLLGVLAGAMAEELCAQYGDTLEPSAVARGMMELYDDMVAQYPILTLGDEQPRDTGSGMARH